MRQRIYLAEDKRAILWLAELFDQIGSKRLRVAMDVELDHLRRHKYLSVSRACFSQLKRIGPSTMDRFRRAEHRPPDVVVAGRSRALCSNKQIKVRTFADRDDKRPGFEEIDLVQHEGGNSSGFFTCTLNVTDVCTGWTEMRAMPTKAQKHVFAALEHIRWVLPFPLLGIDSDNGVEFVNDELVQYCDCEHLCKPPTFTRGRAQE